MSSILYPHEEECSNSIDIDELYQKNFRRSVKHLSIFNKILSRIHKRIQNTSRNKRNDLHIWFSIPEFIFGEPLFDQSDCIAHIIGKLTDNGFLVKYMHPNTIFVSWEQWIPSYIRDEYKKKTGIVVDQNGIVIKSSKTENSETKDTTTEHVKDINKHFTPISKYKPTGHLLYDAELFDAIK